MAFYFTRIVMKHNNQYIIEETWVPFKNKDFFWFQIEIVFFLLT